ncbi:MAG: hypothetical protein K9H64_23320 [Bacteroidales bacterium]|nr:hypothetical protein [Bacteroidales bacterium]MCF8458961.1 hypothetical protein [Bacteroidales bacterium]
MKKAILLSLLAIMTISCEKDKPLIDGELSIYFTGQTLNENYEFILSNKTNKPVAYWGYEEGFPIYQLSVLSDTGWVDSGPGWCGTGLSEIMLNAGDSFTISVYKPIDYQTWRVGLHIYLENDEEGQLLWSEAVN